MTSESLFLGLSLLRDRTSRIRVEGHLGLRDEVDYGEHKAVRDAANLWLRRTAQRAFAPADWLGPYRLPGTAYSERPQEDIVARWDQLLGYFLNWDLVLFVAKQSWPDAAVALAIRENLPLDQAQAMSADEVQAYATVGALRQTVQP